MSDRIFAMDVERREFSKKMRGYDPEEVRAYLRAVADEMGRLNLDNQTLREEVGHLNARLDDFRERERTLQDTLVTAQRMSGEIKDKSQRESELLVKEARVKAERILEQAQDQLHAIENEIGRLHLEKDAFENRLRSTVGEHLALLDLRKQERGDLDNLRFLRRRSSNEVG
jgi:cell division initiation protein